MTPAFKEAAASRSLRVLSQTLLEGRPVSLPIRPVPPIIFTRFDFGGNAMPAMPWMPPAPRRPQPPSAPAQPAPPAAPDFSGGPASPAGSGDGATRSEAAAPERPRPSALGTAALAVARKEIGVTEDPKGSNRGPRVDQYQDGKGQSWCAHFVSWCVRQVGESPFGHLAAVEALRRWAQARGLYLPADTNPPLAGDIFTMARTDAQGRIVGGHTGFVQGYDARGGRVRTVEGNSGDAVAERTRSVTALDGFIRL